MVSCCLPHGAPCLQRCTATAPLTTLSLPSKDFKRRLIAVIRRTLTRIDFKCFCLLYKLLARPHIWNMEVLPGFRTKSKTSLLLKSTETSHKTTEPAKGHAEKKLSRAHEIASRYHEMLSRGIENS